MIKLKQRIYLIYSVGNIEGDVASDELALIIWRVVMPMMDDDAIMQSLINTNKASLVIYCASILHSAFGLLAWLV